MDQVRVAVVGTGSIAQIIHLPILTRLNEAHLVAICDIDKAKAQHVADRFGIKRYYTSVEEMIKLEDLQGAIIATPTHVHKSTALPLLESGVDILVEKPLAHILRDAEAIVEAASRLKRKLMVGMNNRFRPDAMILKSFVEGGELGKIFYTKAGWLKRSAGVSAWFKKKEKAGGGVFLDLGIVMLDLALWMMGYPDPLKVSATMYKHTSKDVEDSALAFLRMKNGSTLSIEVSWMFPTGEDFFYCDSYGTNGSAMINPFRILKTMHENLVNVTPQKIETPQNMFRRSYENEVKHFLGAIRGLRPVVSTGEEAVHRMKIVDAIYKSAARGKEITLK
ncbi:MAG: Gfo/Idh/MocA family oxidoreductase [Bacteroidota bacterium]